MNNFYDAYEDTKGIFWSNLLGTVGWIIFLVKLLSYNKILLSMVNENDGIFMRAIKLIFSDEFSNMGTYLLITIALIIWLIFNIYKNIQSIKSENNYYGYGYITYIYGTFTAIQIGGIFALFFSILAPILVSFVVITVIIFAFIYFSDK